MDIMGIKSRFKYICDSCNAENWLTARDRSSHFKPHCVECGSLWLSPSKKSRGPEKLKQWSDAQKEYIEILDKKMGKK